MLPNHLLCIKMQINVCIFTEKSLKKEFGHKKITQTVSRKRVTCDIVVRKLCKYIPIFEFINARIFSCQFFKYLPISSALKKSINILPLILSALNLKLSTWRPAPHAHSFLFHFMEKKGKYHLQQFWILSLA